VVGEVDAADQQRHELEVRGSYGEQVGRRLLGRLDKRRDTANFGGRAGDGLDPVADRLELAV
jgi:hypothetical protein